jgi:hypothetical protein
MEGKITAKEKGSQADCITKFFELANTELFKPLLEAGPLAVGASSDSVLKDEDATILLPPSLSVPRPDFFILKLLLTYSKSHRIEGAASDNKTLQVG